MIAFRLRVKEDVVHVVAEPGETVAEVKQRCFPFQWERGDVISVSARGVTRSSL